MKSIVPFFLSLSLLFNYGCLAQEKDSLNSMEKESLKVFKNFKSFLVKSIKSQEDLTDTINLKHILLNYIASEYNLDSTDVKHFKKGEIPKESFENFKSDFNSFYQYFYERRTSDIVTHLSALPIRLSSDKCIFEKFIPFQKENTLVYFDDRYPNKILGYMLFMPKLNTKSNASRIWSWNLQFEAGYWAFKSLMGSVGVEYFISEGVKGPEHPIGN